VETRWLEVGTKVGLEEAITETGTEADIEIKFDFKAN